MQKIKWKNILLALGVLFIGSFLITKTIGTIIAAINNGGDDNTSSESKKVSNDPDTPYTKENKEKTENKEEEENSDEGSQSNPQSGSSSNNSVYSPPNSKPAKSSFALEESDFDKLKDSAYAVDELKELSLGINRVDAEKILNQKGKKVKVTQQEGVEIYEYKGKNSKMYLFYYDDQLTAVTFEPTSIQGAQ